jgi:hypothetical protein
VLKAVDMETKRGGNYMRIQYLLRFLLTGGVLALGALTPVFSLWGVAAGIFTLPIATHLVRFFEKPEDGKLPSGDHEADSTETHPAEN